MSNVLLKNPGDDIDFTMEWNDLGGATLDTVTHTFPAGSGLGKVGETQSNVTTPPTSTVRLSGAAHGRIYQIQGSALLNNGRTLVRTFTLRILAH